MGRVANELADFIILTMDNPRFESPKRIMSDIKKGIRGNRYVIINDREKAIKKAIAVAKEGDIIVIAGKGHEDFESIKNKKIKFNDRKVVENILDKRGLIRCLS